MSPDPGLPGRWRRWWPAGAAAALALVVAVVAVVAVLAGGDRPARLDAGPPAPSTAVPPSSGPPPTPGATAPAPAPGPGIWPFTSEAEAAAAPAASPYRDPQVTAREFARVYLGVDAPLRADAAVPAAAGATVVLRNTIGEGGAPWPDAPVMTEVALQRSPSSGAWTVVGARSPRIVADPDLGRGAVSSPLALRGRAHAFEGTVHVEVREDGMVAGQALGRAVVTGSGTADGSLGPFAGDLAFRAPSRPAGAVVFAEESQASGAPPLLQVTVVRITFARP